VVRVSGIPQWFALRRFGSTHSHFGVEEDRGGSVPLYCGGPAAFAKPDSSNGNPILGGGISRRYRSPIRRNSGLLSVEKKQ
jgi:hypothetical protein